MPDGYLDGIVNNEFAKSAGSILRISPSGDYEEIHTFDNSVFFYAANPLLRGFDNTLYGTTPYNGRYDQGSVFQYVPPAVQ